ncbi:hypothetical protein U1Q18_044662 [Sarracenia purpurea var. burkii]
MPAPLTSHVWLNELGEGDDGGFQHNDYRALLPGMSVRAAKFLGDIYTAVRTGGRLPPFPAFPLDFRRAFPFFYGQFRAMVTNIVTYCPQYIHQAFAWFPAREQLVCNEVEHFVRDTQVRGRSGAPLGWSSVGLDIFVR